jgi:hypothetical protein
MFGGGPVDCVSALSVLVDREVSTGGPIKVHFWSDG